MRRQPSKARLDRRWLAFAAALAGSALASCGGSRHPKVAGPPPEYERPELPDAAFDLRPAAEHDAATR